MEPIPRGKRLFFAVLLVLLSLAGGFAIFELGLRLTYPEVRVDGTYWGLGAFEADARVGYRHAAGFRGRSYQPGAFDVPVEISPQRLRQSNLAAQLEHPRRLLVLGDSMVFGIGVPEDSLFVTLLQEHLNPQGVGVINGGQSGYSIGQEVILGRELVAEMNPTAVILCLYPNNDVPGDYYRPYLDLDVVHGYRLPKNRLWPGPAVDFIRTHSYVWKALGGLLRQRRFRARREEFLRLVEEDAAPLIQPTLAALVEFRADSLGWGIPFGVAVIPPRSGQGELDELLVRGLRDAGVPLLELRPEAEDYFEKDVHLNERGHRAAAQQLLPFAEQLTRTGPGSDGGP